MKLFEIIEVNNLCDYALAHSYSTFTELLEGNQIQCYSESSMLHC